MTFDPNKYMKGKEGKEDKDETKSGFNPNKYLKKKEGTTPSEPLVSTGESSGGNDYDSISNTENARQVPLTKLKKDLEFYRSFYGDDLGNPAKYKQYNELVSVYQERLKSSLITEAPVDEKIRSYRQEAFLETVDQYKAQGLISEEVANKASEDPEAVYDAIVAAKKSEMTKGITPVSERAEGDGLPDIAPEPVEEEGAAPTSDEGDAVPDFAPRAEARADETQVELEPDAIVDDDADRIEKRAAKDAQNEIQDSISSKVIDRVRDDLPEAMSKEGFEEIEAKLKKEGVRVDLSGEGVIGKDVGFATSALNTFNKSIENIALSAANYAMDMALQDTEGFDALRKSRLAFYEEKINEYEKGASEALMEGNVGAAMENSLLTLTESAPLLLAAAGSALLTKNPQAAIATMSALSAAQTYSDVENEEWYKELPALGKSGYLFVQGTAEGYGEMVSARLFKRAFKNAVLSGVGSNGVKKTFRPFLETTAKSMGVASSEEALAEMATGGIQYVNEKIAKGEQISLNELVSTIQESAVQGFGGGAALAGAASLPQGSKILAKKGANTAIAATKTLRVKKADYEIDKTFKSIKKANTPDERRILQERALRLISGRQSISKNESKRIESMSEGQRQEYMDALFAIERLQRKLRKVDPESDAGKVVTEEMKPHEETLSRIDEEISKEQQQEEVTDATKEDAEEQQPVLEGVQTRGDEAQERQEGSELRTEEKEEEQVEYFERNLGGGKKMTYKVEDGKRMPIDPTEVPEDATIKSEEEIGETELAPQQDVAQKSPKAVSLKYEDREIPKSFKEVDGGERAFGEAANVYNKSLDRRQGKEKAYQNAEEYIKQSAAFERAGDSEQMIHDFKKLVGGKTKKAPSANKVLGKNPPKKGFTTKQLISIAEKESARGARAGRKEVKGVVDDFKKQIKETIKAIPKGQLTSNQAKQISNLTTGVRTLSQMKRFAKTAERIINDVEYANKLNEAKKLKKNLSTKNLPSNIVSAFKRFRSLDPSSVQDIDEYIEYAKKLNEYRLSPKEKNVDGRTEIKETNPISIEAMDEYIAKEREFQIKEAAKDAIEELKKEGFSAQELEEMEAKDVVNLLDAINEDDGDSFAQIKDGEKTKEGLKRVIKYNQDDLAGISNSGLKESENKIKEALENVDIDAMNPRDMKDLYVSLVNAIFNNAYNGTDWVRAEYSLQQNKSALFDMRRQFNGKVNQFTLLVGPIQQAMKQLSGTSELAAELQRLTGLSGIFNGRSKAQSKANDFRDGLKEIMKGKLETLEEDVFLSMYSILMTAGPEKFTYYKKGIRDMIDNDLKSSDEEIKKNAKIASQVFTNRISGKKSIKEVKITKNEGRVINYSVDAFAKVKEDFKDISEQVYNMEFIESENGYLPIILRKRKRQEQEELTASNYYQKEYIMKQKDGSLNQRTYKLDPNEFTFDYNFLNSIANKYESQLNDIETARSVNDYNRFHNSSISEQILNGNKSKKSLYDRISLYVSGYKSKAELHNAERAAITMLNKVAEWGVRIKLGKGKQVAVQTVPVLARAMSLLGRNSFDLINVIGDRINDKEFQETIDNLFDNYPISQEDI